MILACTDVLCFLQRNGPRGIPSGGIIITVDGTNFNVIRKPKMYVMYKDKEYTNVSIFIFYVTYVDIQIHGYVWKGFSLKQERHLDIYIKFSTALSREECNKDGMQITSYCSG